MLTVSSNSCLMKINLSRISSFGIFAFFIHDSIKDSEGFAISSKANKVLLINFHIAQVGSGHLGAQKFFN